MTGDISDWRMVAAISATGMSAYLKNMTDPTVADERIFREEWDQDESKLLERIETAVYNNPQVLDDFSSEIVVMTPCALWMPAEEAEADDEAPSKIYNSIYSAREEDISADEVGDLLNLYSLVPGLLPFLKRTFPGARVSNQLSVLVRRFRDRLSDNPRLYIDIRRGECDYILFEGRKLLLGVTHYHHSTEDICRRTLDILSIYSIAPESADVSLSGPREIKMEIMKRLRGTLSRVMLTMVPAAAASGDMPLAAALALRHPTETYFHHAIRTPGQR